MPLYDYKCADCGRTVEVLVYFKDEVPSCPECGSKNLTKLMAAHSSMSGSPKSSFPGHSDTACCGSRPGEKSGCAGPGSCCGKAFG